MLLKGLPSMSLDNSVFLQGKKMLEQMKCHNICETYDDLGNFKMRGELIQPYMSGVMTIVTTLTFNEKGALVHTEVLGVDEEGRVSDFQNLVMGKDLH